MSPDMQKVYDGIKAYCAERHDFGFDPKKPVVRLHEPTFSADEIIAAVDVLLSTRVTMGPKVLAFERAFGEMHGFPQNVTSNSGSSANLLAIAAVANVAAKDALRPGDEVIVPALSWSTTVWPLIQMNLVPVIVDIDPRTLNIDPGEIERAIGPKTRAIMPVHVYGNPCDMRALEDLCRRRGLQMIEDCCEALGARYGGKPVGSFGRAGTFSFYFSHHMTTLEGGITVSGDFELAELMRILRAHGWTRELQRPAPYLEKSPDIDPRFLFVNVGYNLRITELQAAMGLVQLPKLPSYVAARRETTAEWNKDFARWGDYFDLQHETPGAFSSCFGFPLVLRDGAPFTRTEITGALNKAGIETRSIIAGNIALQPALKLYAHRVAGELPNATRVMRSGFSFGNHQAVDAQARRYVRDQFAAFLKKHGG